VHYADVEELRRLVPGCTGECHELLAWFRTRKSKSNAATVVRAAEVAIPADVEKLQSGWSKLGAHRRLSWLAFQLELAAGATRTVTVSYVHVSGDDTRRAVNQTFTYDYLLSPAKRWARFGPLHLTIRVPPKTRLQASLPLTRDGDTYRAELPELPNGELSLEVMSLEGLLFGMTQPAGYWYLLLAALSAVTFGLALRLGRAWSRLGTRLRIVLACIFGTGFVVAVADSVVVWGVSMVFPQRAFGSGYDTAIALVGAIAAFAALGAVISTVRAMRKLQSTS
jgi:hypothetical protein